MFEQLTDMDLYYEITGTSHDEQCLSIQYGWEDTVAEIMLGEVVYITTHVNGYSVYEIITPDKEAVIFFESFDDCRKEDVISALKFYFKNGITIFESIE